MKLYIKSLFFATSIFFAASCSNDWLDVDPSDGVDSTEAINTIKGAQAALIGVYDGIQKSRFYYGAAMLYYGDVRADDMQATKSNKRSASLYEMRYKADDAPNMWNVPYDVIARANNVIVAIENNMVNDGSESAINHIKGQALTLRALAHFDLVRIYAKPYSVDNGASLGVPVITQPLKFNATPARETVAKVYEQVVADLEEAITLMTASHQTGFLNSWSAKALLSRVYLYMENNEQALALAEDIIENASKQYSLWSTEEYVSTWEKAGTSELMFEIVNKNSDDWVDREAIGYLMAEDGYDDIIITENFCKLLNDNKDDVRIGLFKKSSSDKDPNSTKYLYLNKFPGRADYSPQDVRVNNIPVIRLSEVYLNAAEAAVKLGLNDKADDYTNAIYLRANPQADDLENVTLDDVLEERRKELIGEGHRFFDLMRNNKQVVRYTSEYNKGWHVTLNADAQSFDNTYFRAILPIPKKECDANEVLRKQQNPGY
ncbi:MAG: RagB/SusD family nutrient uptake outer membrane protein [Bacteroidales bacterium]|nr:RagB/SusD family nutrient uptake outer membrane protein [Bacteroidales bacterium]